MRIRIKSAKNRKREERERKKRCGEISPWGDCGVAENTKKKGR